MAAPRPRSRTRPDGMTGALIARAVLLCGRFSAPAVSPSQRESKKEKRPRTLRLVAVGVLLPGLRDGRPRRVCSLRAQPLGTVDLRHWITSFLNRATPAVGTPVRVPRRDSPPRAVTRGSSPGADQSAAGRRGEPRIPACCYAGSARDHATNHVYVLSLRVGGSATFFPVERLVGPGGATKINSRTDRTHPSRTVGPGRPGTRPSCRR